VETVSTFNFFPILEQTAKAGSIRMQNTLASMKAQSIEPDVHLSQSRIEPLVPGELRDSYFDASLTLF
jgi:hypothetical protein